MASLVKPHTAYIFISGMYASNVWRRPLWRSSIFAGIMAAPHISWRTALFARIGADSSHLAHLIGKA